jgi:hypothetical protein
MNGKNEHLKQWRKHLGFRREQLIKKLVAENPKGRSGESHIRWDLMRDGMTVGEYCAVVSALAKAGVLKYVKARPDNHLAVAWMPGNEHARLAMQDLAWDALKGWLVIE